MKRQAKLNEKTIEKAIKEMEEIQKTMDKIRKLQHQLGAISEENQWIHYLGKDFTDGATEEQLIKFVEFADMVRKANQY